MASTSDMSLDLSKLKVPDLKKELKLRGLSTTGNKNELMERLQRVLKTTNPASPEDDFEEHLLNDEDDEHLETNESVISELDHVLNDSPQNKSLKRKSNEIIDENNKTVIPKKVILNRNNSHNSEVNKIQPDDNKKDNIESSMEPKVVKLSELSAKERLEMRAKKFGITALTPDAKKAARAERFGSANSGLSSNAIAKTNENTSIDVLKQRAQRFGTNVSSVMSKLETQEKLEQRKARFGTTTTTTTISKDNNGTLTENDKAKLRLERFKQPVK